MLRVRRAVARSLVALGVAAMLMPVMSTPASAITLCNTGSYIIGFANSKYVSTEVRYTGGNSGMLRSRAGQPSTLETYQICSYYEGGTKISYIRSQANGRYVTAEVKYTGGSYGMLRARGTKILAWQKFNIVRWGPNPSMYTIQSRANGRYVTVEVKYPGSSYGMLRARGTKILAWQKILITCGLPARCVF